MLTAFAEVVRRNAGNKQQIAVGVQLELLLICPNVCAFEGHEDWQVATDGNPLLVGVRFQLPPLGFEKKLFEL